MIFLILFFVVKRGNDGYWTDIGVIEVEKA